MTWKERNYQYTPEERERKNKIAKLRYWAKSSKTDNLKQVMEAEIKKLQKREIPRELPVIKPVMEVLTDYCICHNRGPFTQKFGLCKYCLNNSYKSTKIFKILHL
jgi:hypothetical protein